MIPADGALPEAHDYGRPPSEGAFRGVCDKGCDQGVIDKGRARVFGKFSRKVSAAGAEISSSLKNSKSISDFPIFQKETIHMLFVDDLILKSRRFPEAHLRNHLRPSISETPTTRYLAPRTLPLSITAPRHDRAD